MRSLFRAMKIDGSHPRVEQSARGLGVRVGEGGDVQPDSDGRVHPGAGMSVAPDDPASLPRHRRPPAHGGTGRDPVWQITDGVLPATLSFVADAIEHGLIEPAEAMVLAAYQEALAGTRMDWALVP